MTHATIAEPSTHHDLSCILSTPGIQALFLEESQRQTWLDELSEAVEQGHFVLQRTELTGVDIDTIATWLDRNLPRGCVSEGTRNALVSDILRLTNMIEELTAAHWYALRCFTAAPDHRCGFHVDTVPPGAPAWGVLRVYNGQLTDWVEPSQVRSMAAFYHWLHQRDRVVRENPHASIARDAALGFLDDSPDSWLIMRRLERYPPGPR